jgi:alpha-amylase/alpha-mannosidase (GH57 family)
MEAFVCIHAHFYQPPRENAWLEAVEVQDSAFPYHDWNQRITAECYATNTTSRITDENGRIREIVNNYAKISFNFGPTLLSWLERNSADVYQAVLAADSESRQRFSGHGSALAQAYNHMILPLASSRDKHTQVLWGIGDFEHRFQRRPEGMWLPETAVDLETLDILAEHGILFTILAPHQAKRIKRIDGGEWLDVSGGKIDPSRPYLARLPSGQTIALFFYDGAISHAVAFEGLLSNGERLAHRLLEAVAPDRSGPLLMHIATDGESYGHHHPRGNRALTFALHTIETQKLARITVYGEYLELHPPEWEVEIVERSSWSCPHGVERWRTNCGCNSGRHVGSNQTWREPLREALDWLRDSLSPAYEQKMRELGFDPWKTRNDYVRVILDRKPSVVDSFLTGRTQRALTADEKIAAIQLLELERHALLMYTSCGWFFDDISGLETVQVIQYAGRALQIANRMLGDALEPRFMELLEKAKSNIPEHGNGRRIYEKSVKPAMVDLVGVGAHYAMRSLFGEYPEQTSLYCYAASQEFFKSAQIGRTKLAIGRVRITSTISWEEQRFCFGAIHWGDRNVSGCLRPCQGADELEAHFFQEVFDTFNRGEFPASLPALEQSLGTSCYSLRNLFRDDQRHILSIILESTLVNTEEVYRQVYEEHAPLLLFLKELEVPAPRALAGAAEYVLNASFKREFEENTLNLTRIQNLVDAAKMHGVALEDPMLELTIRSRMERIAEALGKLPSGLDLLRELDALASLLPLFPFEVNLRIAQNIFFQILREMFPVLQKKARRRDKKAVQWTALFKSLGDKLGVRTD